MREMTKISAASSLPRGLEIPSPYAPAQGANRRNNFNFLRLFFASLVILSHSSELIDGNQSRELFIQLFHNTISLGGLAVDGFFLLSGYLIVQSWESRPEFLQFLKKRVLRIYPGFFVASLVCVFVVGPLGSKPVEYFSHFEWFPFFRDVLLLRVPVTPPVFEGRPYAVVNGAMWTISREFICYLLVLALGMMGAIKNRRMWLVLSMPIFSVFILSKLGYPIDFLGKHFNLTNPIIHLLSFFFAGGCFHLYKDKIKFDPKVALIFSVLLFICLFNITLAELALISLGGYLLIYFAFSPISFLSRFQTAPDISYGVYLYGWPVQMLLIWYIGDITPMGVFSTAMVICSVLGLVSWYSIEKPFLKLKEFRLGWQQIIGQKA